MIFGNEKPITGEEQQFTEKSASHLLLLSFKRVKKTPPNDRLPLQLTVINALLSRCDFYAGGYRPALHFLHIQNLRYDPNFRSSTKAGKKTYKFLLKPSASSSWITDWNHANFFIFVILPYFKVKRLKSIFLTHPTLKLLRSQSQNTKHFDSALRIVCSWHMAMTSTLWPHFLGQYGSPFCHTGLSPSRATTTPNISFLSPWAQLISLRWDKLPQCKWYTMESKHLDCFPATLSQEQTIGAISVVLGWTQNI